jgi:LacI family transcriptional regulator, galactose operon repressor
LDGHPRITDVAARAGVSPSTVSVVLNDVSGARVSEDTRRRVAEAAELLGYTPNPLARGLRTRRSQTVGFVSDAVACTPYAGRMIQGAQDAAWRAGMLLVLVETGGDRQLERHAIRTLLHRQVDGIVYASFYHRVVEVPQLRSRVPLVLADATPARGLLPSVVPDEAGGASAAVAELLGLGHRRIGLVTEEGDIPAAEGRLRGYRDALDRHGVRFDPALVLRGTAVTSGGHRAVSRLLDMPAPPTAVFCFNDQMAMGAYQAAAERGLRVPEDLSVVGFDDQELIASALSPGLTTVALPHYEMGAWAVKMLLTVIQDTAAGNDQPLQMLMPCPLVRRDSVGPPPNRLDPVNRRRPARGTASRRRSPR